MHMRADASREPTVTPASHCVESCYILGTSEEDAMFRRDSEAAAPDPSSIMQHAPHANATIRQQAHGRHGRPSVVEGVHVGVRCVRHHNLRRCRNGC